MEINIVNAPRHLTSINHTRAVLIQGASKVITFLVLSSGSYSAGSSAHGYLHTWAPLLRPHERKNSPGWEMPIEQ